MKKRFIIFCALLWAMGTAEHAAATVYTWTGTSGTNWANASNWSPSGIPGAGDTAVLQVSSNDPILNVPTTVGAVEVQSGVLFQTLAQLTVSDYVDVASGATLNIAVGNPVRMLDGSVFYNIGTVNGPIVYERTVPANTAIGNVNGLGYRYFSSPVQGTTVAGFSDDLALTITNPYSPQNGGTGNATTPFPNFFFYQESLLSTVSVPGGDAWETPVSTAAALAPGTGCILNIAPGTTVDLRGNPNSGAVATTVTNTAGGSSSGYNLVGNPYPAPIDWDLVHAANASSVGSTIWLRNATSQYGGTFVTYNASGGITIPASAGNDGMVMPMQGFFVEKATTGSSSLAFSPAHRLSRKPATGNGLFYKNDPHQKELYLHMQLETPNGHKDEMAIYSKKGSSDAYDALYDSRQFQYNSLPQPTLFSYIDSLSMKINGVATPDTATEIGLGMYLPENGTYSIKPLFLEHDIDTAAMDFYLLDKQLGRRVALIKDSAYSFVSAVGDFNDRFSIVVEPKAVLLELSDLDGDAGFTVAPNPSDGGFAVYGEDLSGAVYEVYGLEGRRHHVGTLEGEVHRVDLRDVLSAGTYLLVVRKGQGVAHKKIVVR